MTSELMAAAVEIAEREKATRRVATPEEQVEAALKSASSWQGCLELSAKLVGKDGRPTLSDEVETIRAYINQLEERVKVLEAIESILDDEDFQPDEQLEKIYALAGGKGGV